MSFGPYELIERIGAGGMGVVWRARDTQLLRDVAVKVLPAELASDRGWKQRFLHEARVAARLNHPNIVKIFSVGDEDGAMYIAMELVQGEDLGRMIARGPVSATDVVRIGAEVAMALHEAHCAGIVHRDVKPENIFVTPRGGVKVLDFGIAALYGQQAIANTIVGTPVFMSPEQARGFRVDARSDVFSLGAVLYEALAGVAAFEADTLETTLRNVTVAPHPPLRHVPRALAEIIDRCLEKSPDARFATALDLADALEGVADLIPTMELPRLSTGRALVVDDDELARVIMQSALSDAGYDVDEAENGSEAIRQLREHHYDAMFLDLLMPRVDGWTVLDFLRKPASRKPRRVFVATGVKDLTLSDADKSVVDIVLPKPLLPRQMVDLATHL